MKEIAHDTFPDLVWKHRLLMLGRDYSPLRLMFSNRFLLQQAFNKRKFSPDAILLIFQKLIRVLREINQEVYNNLLALLDLRKHKKTKLFGLYDLNKKSALS